MPENHDITQTRGHVLVLHGPNLNALGNREPGIYGSTTLAEIDAELRLQAKTLYVELRIVQSNCEGTLIDTLYENAGWADGVLINPAAYSHTSIALRDALSAVRVPAVEVHLTNVLAREEFRRTLVTAGCCDGVVMGIGARSYSLGLTALLALLNSDV